MFGKSSDERAVRTTRFNTISRIALVCWALGMALTSGIIAGTAFATPGQGVTSTTIASGPLPEAIPMKFKFGGGFGNGLDVSNISIVKNVIAPGGYFGWHQHSGPSWIVVTVGTLTFYEGNDPTCTGHPVSAGQAFFDPGTDTHNARNETGSTVENYVVRMLPAGGAARIDEPDPGVCPFTMPVGQPSQQPPITRGPRVIPE